MTGPTTPDRGPATDSGAGDPEDAPDGGVADGATDGATDDTPEGGAPGDAAATGETATGEREPGEAPESKAAKVAKEPPPAPPPPERLEGAVEALLLASGDSLSAERMRDVLGLPSVVHVREALEKVRARWAGAGLAVEVQDVAGGHRAVTRPEYAEYVRRLARKPAVDRLTQPLLETLSIVAYRQPVSRAEIERIRGVQAGEALRALLDRRLVKVAGRSDQPGRPLLYATTHRFLEVFGLANLEDLPNAKDLTRL